MANTETGNREFKLVSTAEIFRRGTLHEELRESGGRSCTGTLVDPAFGCAGYYGCDWLASGQLEYDRRPASNL